MRTFHTALALVAGVSLSVCSFTGPTGQQVDEIYGYGPPFNYEATDVRAFDSQGFRAELEKIIAQQNAETVQAITPEIADFLDAAVQAATKIATGGAL